MLPFTLICIHFATHSHSVWSSSLPLTSLQFESSLLSIRTLLVCFGGNASAQPLHLVLLWMNVLPFFLEFFNVLLYVGFSYPLVLLRSTFWSCLGNLVNSVTFKGYWCFWVCATSSQYFWPEENYWRSIEINLSRLITFNNLYFILFPFLSIYLFNSLFFLFTLLCTYHFVLPLLLQFSFPRWFYSW